ncbi:helix-turn-helix domain-containing protein [Candidatus Burkholderia verschuerenii]|uniref:helix-turn-helix domain-containing protein n=1 Tax=Candidatus Burkholderia verschuerenii TaxID=242163 RepID=UPI0009FB61CB
MERPRLPARTLFSQAVRVSREKHGISGNDFAAAAGISRNTLHLIENKDANVRLDTVGQIALALKTDPCAFFGSSLRGKPTKLRIANLRRSVAGNIRRIRESKGLGQKSND